jgi:PAS domain-containing protein
MDAAQVEICEWYLLTNKIIPLKNYKLLFSLDSNTTAKVSKNFLDFVHPEDYKSVTQAILRCIEEKIDFSDEFRMISPTGKTHWICARGKISFNENGKATKIALILKNIDDRCQAETSAINSETKWRSLIEYSSEFITIIGLNDNSSDWAIKFVSFSIQRILGYIPFNLLGEDFLNLVHSSDLPYVIKSLQQVLREPDKVIIIKYKYLIGCI